MPRISQRRLNIEARILDAARRMSWKRQQLKAIYLSPQDMADLVDTYPPRPKDNIGGVPLRLGMHSKFYAVGNYKAII